jgi:fructuronate reductase
VAAWLLHLRGLGAPVKDARTAEVAPFGEGTLEESTAKVLAFLDAGLAADERVQAAVVAHARELEAQAGAARP